MFNCPHSKVAVSEHAAIRCNFRLTLYPVGKCREVMRQIMLLDVIPYICRCRAHSICLYSYLQKIVWMQQSWIEFIAGAAAKTRAPENVFTSGFDTVTSNGPVEVWVKLITLCLVFMWYCTWANSPPNGQWLEDVEKLRSDSFFIDHSLICL